MNLYSLEIWYFMDKDLTQFSNKPYWFVIKMEFYCKTKYTNWIAINCIIRGFVAKEKIPLVNYSKISGIKKNIFLRLNEKWKIKIQDCKLRLINFETKKCELYKIL